MKKEIHPTYEKSIVTCASCGTTFETRSTIPQISVEICSVCHPFYTGKQKLIDTAGRVDRFKERVRASQQMQQTKAPKAVAKEADTVELPDAEPTPEEASQPAAE